MLKIIGGVLLFGVIMLVLLGLGSAILLSLAYGLGLLVSLVAHFEPFQSTVLALAAIFATAILAERIWAGTFSGTTYRPSIGSDDYEEDEDEEDEEDEDDEDDEEFDQAVEELFVNRGIPRWRQPLKQTDFSDVKPDARCPCGSGRKYKNCHGAKQAKSPRG
jgi:hypothetical protein